jgi:hypothetical protein
VEGSIAGFFRLRVQPAEIGRRLERAMLDGRTASVGVTLAPNIYDVRLHPDDAAAFTGWEHALSREMETWLAELAFARGLSTIGPIRVRIAADPSVSRRSVRAEGRFANDDTPLAERSDGPRRKLRLLPAAPGVPGLTLFAGPRTIGRAEDNDLVLRDPEASRHHARLEPEGLGWRVVDLGSTNGTWVNGARVDDESINVGDEVTFGGTRFTVGPG